MPTTLIHTIGPGGDFETLAAFAQALPPSLVAADQIWVAELGDLAEDPGAAMIRTVCDATRYVHLRAAPGQGFADLMDPEGDVLAPTPGLGALVRTPIGDAIRAEGAGTRVHVTGLQIIAEDGAALADDGDGAFVDLRGLLIEADTSAPAVTLRGTGAEFTDSAVIQHGSGDGLHVVDGGRAEALTIVKPERVVADGTGVSLEGSGAIVRAVAAFGFRRAFGPGSATLTAVASDQINALAEPENFASAYWTAISSTVDVLDTIPGPYGVPLQRLGNNQNSFARFDGPVFASVPAGAKVSYSAIVAQPSTLVSAILLDSAAGRPELRVTWTATPPVLGLFGQTGALQLIDGKVTDLGGGAYRLLLVALNTTGSALDVSATFYVTRGTENAGLNVGLYAGAQMAGVGHLGEGYVPPGSIQGSNLFEGLDPADALRDAGGLPDLRPMPGGPLEAVVPVLSETDIYRRPRLNIDTLGAVSLNTGPMAAPADALHNSTLDPVRLIDRDDIVTAALQRRVLVSGSDRRCPV